MELIGKLNQKAENAAGKEEAKKLIKQASVKLTDEELEQVSGGYERLVVKDIVKQI
jgi:bacteriocin-like protein